MDSTISTVQNYPLYRTLSSLHGCHSTTSTAMRHAHYSPLWMRMRPHEAAGYSTLGYITNCDYLSTMNRMIPPMVVYLEKGLGNRLKALVSGICGADEVGKQLRAIWVSNADCGAKFGELFDLSASSLPCWVHVHDQVLQVNQPQHVVDTQAEWDGVKGMSTVIHTKSGSRFHTTNQVKFVYWLQHLKPQAAIVAAVQTALAGSHPVVGVHLRRTDNRVSINGSPTESFITAMQAYPATTKFFVASDSANDRVALETAFPGRVITVARTLLRTTPQGMVDALKDFVGLSKCSEILGSKGSSFSEMAALYGGVKLTVVT